LVFLQINAHYAPLEPLVQVVLSPVSSVPQELTLLLDKDHVQVVLLAVEPALTHLHARHASLAMDSQMVHVFSAWQDNTQLEFQHLVCLV